MENLQAYLTPVASPALSSLPSWATIPMASCSEYDTSDDRSPSTLGHTSDLTLCVSHDSEPTPQEFGDYSQKEINDFSYDGFGVPTPRCIDHLCTCHNNDQTDHFSRDTAREIGSTSSHILAHLRNDSELLNSPPHYHLGSVDFSSTEGGYPLFQVHTPAGDTFASQDGWDHCYTELEDLLWSVDPGPSETEPAVISALRSIRVQMSYVNPFPSEMILPKLMDCSALKCLKEMVSLWATGPQSMPLLNFLLDFCQNQGWFEERIWRNDLGIGELKLWVMSERGRRELFRIWHWVSANTDQLRASGLDVPSAEELDIRRKRLESLPNEFSLTNVRLKNDTEIVQVCTMMS